LEHPVHVDDPPFIAALTDAKFIVRAGEAGPFSQVYEVGDGEASSVLLWLFGEQLAAQVVEAARLRCQRQGVVGPHGLRAEEATHPVLDRDRSSGHLSSEHVPRHFLELPTVRALRVLEKDEPAMGTIAAD
jgi:hypothetical protein